MRPRDRARDVPVPRWRNSAARAVNTGGRWAERDLVPAGERPRHRPERREEVRRARSQDPRQRETSAHRDVRESRRCRTFDDDVLAGPREHAGPTWDAAAGPEAYVTAGRRHDPAVVAAERERKADDLDERVSRVAPGQFERRGERCRIGRARRGGPPPEAARPGRRAW